MRLGRIGLRLYSCDAAFVLGCNLALSAVVVLLLTWLLLAAGPSLPIADLPASTLPTGCVYLAGQCW